MMSIIAFVLLSAAAIYFFAKRIVAVRRNIFLGRKETINDRSSERWAQMTRVALGQSKMVVRPVAGFFHILIYVGFVLINLEVLEIFIDGVSNNHRIFAPYLGAFYDVLISFFELLALGVIIACIVFLARRWGGLKRFKGIEMQGFPTRDAAIILIVEVVLMKALFIMDAADMKLSHGEHSFLVSSWLSFWTEWFTPAQLETISHTAWWFHLVGIFAFLNYVPYSKHFHIFMAFPNTWYGSLDPAGKLNNMESVKSEVKMMMDPNANPYAAPASDAPLARLGAKDVADLSWKSLMDAYTCTECGRCTSVCPANQTGKKLSPRKIMMDTRDRLEEVGKNIDQHGMEFQDGKSLLGDYISVEEIRACTTCNACVEACPVLINPVDIIVDLRRYLTLEESNIPVEWGMMNTNIQNNGAPWKFPASDRGNWAQNNG
jgi:heterodisulfide reductase subunit C